MKCPNCKNNISDNAVFCPVCGEKIVLPVKEVVREEPKQQETIEKKKKKGRSIFFKLIIFIFVIVFAFAVLIVFGILEPIDITGKKANSVQETESEMSEEQDTVEEILEVIQKYVDAEEYKTAIEYINGKLDVVEENEEILAELDACKEKYKAEVLTEAQPLFDEEKYEDAILVLEKALELLEDNQDILDMKTKCENKIPVELQYLDTFYSDYSDERSYSKKILHQNLKDKLGNSYEDCIEYVRGTEEAVDIYILGKDYSRFTGTLFVPEHRTKEGDDFNKNTAYEIMYFSIYGDDKLLYKSPEMGIMAYPEEFDVDVSGVEQLKVNWYTCSNTCEIGLADGYLHRE